MTPLPQMDRNLPQIDILPAVEHPFIKLPDQLKPADTWALGEGQLDLQVNNKNPIQVDVVANLSWGINAGVLLQMSNVLTQLNLQNGCVRFSAIDALRRKTYLQSAEASRADWQNLQTVLEEPWREAFMKSQTVTIDELSAKRPSPDVYARFLKAIVTAPGACEGQSRPFRHVLIAVSDALPFSLDLKMEPVGPESINTTECYHLELSAGGNRSSDVMATLLKSLHPVQFRLSRPLQFRRVLAQLIRGLEQPPSGPAAR